MPNHAESADNKSDFRMLSQGLELGDGWVSTGGQSGREYASLGPAAPEFGPRRLYANLGRAAGQDINIFAVICDPAR